MVWWRFFGIFRESNSNFHGGIKMSNRQVDIFSIGATHADGSVVVIHRSFPRSPENPLAISCTHIEPIADAPAGNPQTMVRLYRTNTGENLGIHAVQESADKICALFRKENVTQPVRSQPVGRTKVMLCNFVQECGLVL